jgi:predicted nucleotidyltransferase
MNVERALREITALIVRCLDPEQILLFGSVAKGNAGPHSDLDLLVIGDFAGPRHRRGGELRGLLDRFPVRIDLHLLTRQEIDTEARRPYSWLATIRSTALVLYPR